MEAAIAADEDIKSVVARLNAITRLARSLDVEIEPVETFTSRCVRQDGREFRKLATDYASTVGTDF
jgi:hypothetical protein